MACCRPAGRAGRKDDESVASGRTASGPQDAGDRRRNRELRERLDEMVELARKLCRVGAQMSPEELEEARQRIEWLAEEIWKAAVYGQLEERVPDQERPG